MTAARTSRFERASQRATWEAQPLIVQLELTHRCNLGCVHCYLDLAHPRPELDTEAWRGIIDQLAEAGTLFVNLTGGEVTLRPDWLEIAGHVRARGLALTVLSSGTRFDRQTVARLAALRPVAVELSLYSARAAVHDRIVQRRRAHRKTLRAAVMLRRAGVPLVLKCPILRSNADEIGGVRQLAERLGARWRFDPAVVARRDGRLEPVQERPTPEQLARALVQLKLTPSESFTREARQPDQPVCAIARRAALIGPNGDVYACGMHPESAGNVLRTPFARIWAESPLLQSLRGLRTRDLPGCSGCSKSGSCGRCSAMALIEDGDLLGIQRAACARAEAKEIADGLRPPSRASRTVKLPVMR